MSCERRKGNSPGPGLVQAGAPVVPSKRTWEACAALPESRVPLAQLEDGVRFGDELAEPMRYDAGRHVLCYRGIMSHASFVKLQKLSRDRLYQRALEQLFVATALSQPADQAAAAWPIWAGAGAAAAALVAGALWFALGHRTLPGTVSDHSDVVHAPAMAPAGSPEDHVASPDSGR